MPDNRDRFKVNSLGEMDKRLSTIDETFDGILRDLADTLQTENLQDCEFSIGSTIRQFGPFIYGYSVSMDGKGNTSIREFGNITISKETQDESPLVYSQERLVDVIIEPKQVRILAELHGVDKSRIKTTVTKNSVTIRAVSRSSKYQKRVQLAIDVDPETSHTRYNNGCLEITLRKLEGSRNGRIPSARIPENHS